MMINALQRSVLISLFIGTGVAHATTVNVGPTYNLPNVTGLKAVNAKLSQDQIQRLTNQATSLQPKEDGFQPLTTKLKHCTNFQSKQVAIIHLAHPMFVVGDDQASLDWLKQNNRVLEKSGAVGLVIHAKHLDSLKQIRAVAGDLTLYPAKGDVVWKLFGINCYPVLISKHWIEH